MKEGVAMKKGPAYWHIIVLGFIAAVLNELTNLLIKPVTDNTWHFALEALKFILIAVGLAIAYWHFYLKKLPEKDKEN